MENDSSDGTDALSQILERIHDLNEEELQMVLSFIDEIIREDEEIIRDTSTDNEDEDDQDENDDEEDEEPPMDINSQEFKNAVSRISSLNLPPLPGTF